MEDQSNVLYRILDVIKQPAPKGMYGSTIIDERDFSYNTKLDESQHSTSTSKQSSNIHPHAILSCSNNHMPQLSELSLAGGTVHTDRLLPQIEELSVALKNFAPALKTLRLPICSNYVFKVREN